MPELDDNETPRRPLSAANRRQAADAKLAQLKAAGELLDPVSTKARSIATSFWGRSWCLNLCRYSDYESRLTPARSLLRSGAVLDLKVSEKHIAGKVLEASTGELYDVNIRITALDPEIWDQLKKNSAGQIHALLDLLKGQLSADVMKSMIAEDDGLFPNPSEIKCSCNCLDWADMCGHAAAVLYGLAVRLDKNPELLFTLRGVDHHELIATAANAAPLTQGENLVGVDLGELFGIDLEI